MSTIKHQTLPLPGGLNVPFRLIRSDDVPALQRFHTRLSEKTIYLRFFGSLKELPKKKAELFAYVDGVDHLAFVALDPDDPDEIIALVRYDRQPGSEKAEYAALVEDLWQGHGVGVALTRLLVDEARDKEVRFLYAMVMGKNTRMLKLLRHLDLPERERLEDGIRHVEIEIGAKEAA